MNPQKAMTQAEIDALWHNQDANQHHIEACRQALDAAKTRLCPHGVLWRNCRRHDDKVVQGEVVG